jgi:hypothetical protein
MDIGGSGRNAGADQALIARIQATGWGVFLIWVGVALIADVGWGIALIGAGVISLGAQLARRLSALPVERWNVGFGVCLVAAGLVLRFDLVSDKSPLPVWIFPVAIMALGVAILASAWLRRDRSS